MSESSGKSKDGNRRKARIGGKARGVFLRALRRGASQEEAARKAGFSRSAFFRLRGRDAGFAASCEAAVEGAARAAPRRGAPRRCAQCGCLPAPGENVGEGHAIRPARGRRLQRRRASRVEFTPARQDVVLAHFAGTCNLAEAAEVAGVSESTVFKCLARDPDFAERFQAALAQSYQHLEAELLRQRLEAQRRAGRAEATGEFDPEFERALKLLQRWERKDGSLGPRRQVRSPKEAHSVDEAIEAMERKLKAIGIPIRDFPPPGEEEEGGGDSHFNAPPCPDGRAAGESDCPLPDAGGDSHFNAPPHPDDRSADESDCPPDHGAEGDSHFIGPRRPSGGAGA